jgi:hypothetical protein
MPRGDAILKICKANKKAHNILLDHETGWRGGGCHSLIKDRGAAPTEQPRIMLLRRYSEATCPYVNSNLTPFDWRAPNELRRTLESYLPTFFVLSDLSFIASELLVMLPGPRVQTQL